MILHGLVKYISESSCPRVQAVQRPGIVVHPWQTDLPLPSNVTMDTSHLLQTYVFSRWLGDMAKKWEDVDIRALQPSS